MEIDRSASSEVLIPVLVKEDLVPDLPSGDLIIIPPIDDQTIAQSDDALVIISEPQAESIQASSCSGELQEAVAVATTERTGNIAGGGVVLSESSKSVPPNALDKLTITKGEIPSGPTIDVFEELTDIGIVPPEELVSILVDKYGGF
jgi:hypothetical protein